MRERCAPSVAKDLFGSGAVAGRPHQFETASPQLSEYLYAQLPVDRPSNRNISTHFRLLNVNDCRRKVRVKLWCRSGDIHLELRDGDWGS